MPKVGNTSSVDNFIEEVSKSQTAESIKKQAKSILGDLTQSSLDDLRGLIHKEDSEKLQTIMRQALVDNKLDGLELKSIKIEIAKMKRNGEQKIFAAKKASYSFDVTKKGYNESFVEKRMKQYLDVNISLDSLSNNQIGWILSGVHKLGGEYPQKLIKKLSCDPEGLIYLRDNWETSGSGKGKAISYYLQFRSTLLQSMIDSIIDSTTIAIDSHIGVFLKEQYPNATSNDLEKISITIKERLKQGADMANLIQVLKDLKGGYGSDRQILDYLSTLINLDLVRKTFEKRKIAFKIIKENNSVKKQVLIQREKKFETQTKQREKETSFLQEVLSRNNKKLEKETVNILQTAQNNDEAIQKVVKIAEKNNWRSLKEKLLNIYKKNKEERQEKEKNTSQRYVSTQEKYSKNTGTGEKNGGRYVEKVGVVTQEEFATFAKQGVHGETIITDNNILHRYIFMKKYLETNGMGFIWKNRKILVETLTHAGLIQLGFIDAKDGYSQIELNALIHGVLELISDGGKLQGGNTLAFTRKNLMDYFGGTTGIEKRGKGGLNAFELKLYEKKYINEHGIIQPQFFNTEMITKKLAGKK